MPAAIVRRTRVAGAAATLIALGGIGAGEIAGQVSLGAQASSGDNAGFGIGPRIELDLGPFDAGLRVVGSFEVFFPGKDFENATVSLRDVEDANVSIEDIELDYWEANLNLAYDLLSLLPLTPYVGGGLNFAHTEVANSPGGVIDVRRTETGINLLAGAQLDAGSVAPFFEVRLEVGGGEQFVITGGLLF